VERRSIDAIIRALEGERVRYLIVDGLAVVAHGYVRFTADLDLVVDLDSSNVRRALEALASLGYRPRAPVELDEFADAGKRAQWIREKGMTVFSLHSPDHAATEVDLFVEMPLDFDKAYASALRAEVARGVTATFASLDDLVALKRRAGRPKDLHDIEKLERARREPEE
jgi:hypothetical protein